MINYKFLFKNMYLQLNIINIEWKENAPLLPVLFIIYRNVFRGKKYVCMYIQIERKLFSIVLSVWIRGHKQTNCGASHNPLQIWYHLVNFTFSDRVKNICQTFQKRIIAITSASTRFAFHVTMRWFVVVTTEKLLCN